MPNAPTWRGPTNWTGGGAFPGAPPTPPSGKLSYNDWWNKIGQNMAYSASFGSPGASYLDYLGGSGTPAPTPPTTGGIAAPPAQSSPTQTQGPTQPAQPPNLSSLTALINQINSPQQAQPPSLGLNAPMPAQAPQGPALNFGSPDWFSSTLSSLQNFNQPPGVYGITPQNNPFSPSNFLVSPSDMAQFSSYAA